MSEIKTKDKLSLFVDLWDDPGDYPNALASGPMPSYEYIESVEGTVEVEWHHNEFEINPSIDEVIEHLQEEFSEVKASWYGFPNGDLCAEISEWEIDNFKTTIFARENSDTINFIHYYRATPKRWEERSLI